MGCGDGSVHVIDILAGNTLYGLGAHKVGWAFSAGSLCVPLHKAEGVLIRADLPTRIISLHPYHRVVGYLCYRFSAAA